MLKKTGIGFCNIRDLECFRKTWEERMEAENVPD